MVDQIVRDRLPGKLGNAICSRIKEEGRPRVFPAAAAAAAVGMKSDTGKAGGGELNSRREQKGVMIGELPV